MPGLHSRLVSQKWILSSYEETLHTQGNPEGSVWPFTLCHLHTSWINSIHVCPLLFLFPHNTNRSKHCPAWSNTVFQWYLGILHETTFRMIRTRPVSLGNLRVGYSQSISLFCQEFCSPSLIWGFIHKFVKITASEAPIAKLSDWVYRILLHIQWTLVTASLKKLFIAYHEILGTSSLEYSSLNAISIASSTGTFVYKLLTSKDTTSSSSSSLVASRAALASFELVSIFAPGNLSKKGERKLLRFLLLLPGIDRTGRSGVPLLCTLASPWSLAVCDPVVQSLW